MTRQYLRSLSLSIGNGSSGTTIATSQGGPGLRVRFEIYQHDVSTPDNALITITNLSNATAQKIQKEYDRVILQAGYGDNIATIFEGEIKQKIGNGQETPVETYFKIVAAAGQKAYSYGFISKTLAAGHTFKDQVNACIDALKPYGVVAGYIADLGTAKMPRGRAMFGMVREQLHDIAAATNTSWWIDGNKLNIVKNDGYLPGAVTVINSQTGMIGIPIQTIQGVQVRCLLNPNIIAGSLIQLNEADIQQFVGGVSLNDSLTNQQVPALASQPKAGDTATDGVYRVLYVSKIGDTRGTEWYSDLICISAGSSYIGPANAARGITIPDSK